MFKVAAAAEYETMNTFAILAILALCLLTHLLMMRDHGSHKRDKEADHE